MPSNVESQFLTALTKRDLLAAHTLLEDLSATCSESHHRFLRAHFKAHLSAFNLPEAFAEMMEVAVAPDLTLQTALYICVEGSSLASQLFDAGRMERVQRLFKKVKARHPNDPLVRLWTGPVLLNQANLAAHLGNPTAIALYRAAAKAMAPFERLWCQNLAAYSRLAAACECAGHLREAGEALARAESLLRGDRNKQEFLLARARMLLCRGRPDEALVAAVEAYRLAAAVSDQFVLVESLRYQGESLLTLERAQEAAVRFSQARDLALSGRLYHLLNGPLSGAAAPR